MKIAVTGHKGRLGSALVDVGCIPIDCDITKIASVCDAVYSINPDIIIHCAGITDVDWIEANPDDAFKVNVRGLNNLLNCVGKMYPRPKIIFISTDYIFNGKKGMYSEKDKPDPIGNYGMLKLAGEVLMDDTDVIVRTTILYGSKAKPDFVTRILSQLDDGKQFDVPCNMFGNPTHVDHLSVALLRLCELENPPHIVNISGLDYLSRYEFSLIIAKIFGKNALLINPVEVKQSYRPLKAGLRLHVAKGLGLPLYTVQDGLKEMKRMMKLQ